MTTESNEMKKNKYRWREMNDDPPKICEIVICVFGDESEIPYDESAYCVCTYRGNLENGETLLQCHLPFPENHVLVVYESPFIKWRKMCKLPGEK